MREATFDAVVVGGGIVGLATAMALSERFPGLSLAVLEKEPSVAMHQTGHNSGVIHSGIYYRPGSLKARLCVEGARLMKAFCARHGIRHELCGKVIVAADEGEIPRLEALYRQGLENGVPGLELIGPEELRRIEPYAGGVAALYSPTTGIVDYGEVARAMAALLAQRGVQVRTGARLLGISARTGSVRMRTASGDVEAAHFINCAGLYSDRVARMAGLSPPVRIVPFRGEYFRLAPHRRHLVRGLIYPVPDPRLPFLGVHLTRTVHGDVEIGPNAVLAFAREGYTLGRVHVAELWDAVSYRGFWSMARRWWKTGLGEYYRSLNVRAFVRALRRLLPEVGPGDLERAPAGVRAQAVAPDGSLVDDFVIVEEGRGVHVLNAPSPAATASLAIGRFIADVAARRFGLS